MLARDRLVGIQAARGAAALLVVFYHAGRMLSLDQYVGNDPLRGLFRFGHAGVDFFFVLSGFIIYFVHHKDRIFSSAGVTLCVAPLCSHLSYILGGDTWCDRLGGCRSP